MKDKILKEIDEKIAYYQELSLTANGFQGNCLGGVHALKEHREFIESLEDF